MSEPNAAAPTEAEKKLCGVLFDEAHHYVGRLSEYEVAALHFLRAHVASEAAKRTAARTANWTDAARAAISEVEERFGVEVVSAEHAEKLDAENTQLRAQVEALKLKLRSIEAATDLETARRRAII